MKRMIMAAFVLAATLGLGATAMASDGAAIYKSKCQACHGVDGKGTPMAPAFAGSEYLSGADDADIADTITKGRNGADKHYKNFAMGMPPQKLNDGDLSAVIDYLKTLAN